MKIYVPLWLRLLKIHWFSRALDTCNTDHSNSISYHYLWRLKKKMIHVENVRYEFLSGSETIGMWPDLFFFQNCIAQGVHIAFILSWILPIDDIFISCIQLLTFSFFFFLFFVCELSVFFFIIFFFESSLTESLGLVLYIVDAFIAIIGGRMCPAFRFVYKRMQ